MLPCSLVLLKRHGLGLISDCQRSGHATVEMQLVPSHVIVRLACETRDAGSEEAQLSDSEYVHFILFPLSVSAPWAFSTPGTYCFCCCCAYLPPYVTEITRTTTGATAMITTTGVTVCTAIFAARRAITTTTDIATTTHMATTTDIATTTTTDITICMHG